MTYSKVEKSRTNQGFQKGRAKTGGRKKGTLNKNSIKVNEYLQDNDINLIEELLEIAQTTNEEMVKFYIYKELMKYCYPQLKATDLNVSTNSGINIIVADEKHKKMLEEL